MNDSAGARISCSSPHALPAQQRRAAPGAAPRSPRPRHRSLTPRLAAPGCACRTTPACARVRQPAVPTARRAISAEGADASRTACHARHDGHHRIAPALTADRCSRSTARRLMPLARQAGRTRRKHRGRKPPANSVAALIPPPPLPLLYVLGTPRPAPDSRPPPMSHEPSHVTSSQAFCCGAPFIFSPVRNMAVSRGPRARHLPASHRETSRSNQGVTPYLRIHRDASPKPALAAQSCRRLTHTCNQTTCSQHRRPVNDCYAEPPPSPAPIRPPYR